MNQELPDVQAGFRKEGTRGQIAKICHIIEKAREFQKASTSTSEGFDYSKTFDCVDHNKLWKILEEMGITDHLTCLLRNLYVVKKQQLELDLGQWTDSILGKEYLKALYCHLACLTYMQSTSCEILGWMQHKPEWRLLGKLSTTSYIQIIAL